jgi:hypothetical protein
MRGLSPVAHVFLEAMLTVVRILCAALAAFAGVLALVARVSGTGPRALDAALVALVLLTGYAIATLLYWGVNRIPVKRD